MSEDTKAFFAVIGIFTLGSLTLFSLVWGVGSLGEFIAKVRDYQTAHQYKLQLDSLESTCNELLNERDALRAELLLQESRLPYRGPTAPPGDGEK